MAKFARKLKTFFGIYSQKTDIYLEKRDENKPLKTTKNGNKKASKNQNKRDKRIKKADPPTDADERPKKRKIRGKKKKSKEIHKICSYCLEWFITYRMDTKYCCDSCKVTASKNKCIRWNYANVGEHILVEAISRIINEIKGYDGEIINRSQMDYWIKLTLFIIKLFDSVIIEGNEHFLFAKNNVLGFLENLQKKYHDVPDIQEWHLTLPKDLIEMWQEFLIATDYGKDSWSATYMNGKRVK